MTDKWLPGGGSVKSPVSPSAEEWGDAVEAV